MSSLLKKFFGAQLGNNDEFLKSDSSKAVWDEITTDDIIDNSNVGTGNLTDALNQIKNDLNLP